MSFVGFVSHYVYFLDPFRPMSPRESPVQRSSSPTSEPGSPLPAPGGLHNPILLLGGYSYGAMVTANLPPLETVLAPFNAPACGSSAAEIRLRAQHLAEMQNTVLASARAAAIDRQNGRSVRKSLGLRVGGDEDNRKSHDSRHSFSSDLEDKIHKGVAELRMKAKKGHRRRLASGEGHGMVVDAGEPDTRVPSPEYLLPLPGRIGHRPAYLLISPLQGIVTNLATMSFPSPLTSLSRKMPMRSLSWSGRATDSVNDEDAVPKSPSTTDAERKLISNPTLAIYGDSDGFVAARKLRNWASRFEGIPDSKFRAHEVSSAGHFWAQGNAAVVMRDAVTTFANKVLTEYTI